MSGDFNKKTDGAVIDKARAFVYNNRRLSITLRLISYMTVGLTVIAYAIRLLSLFFDSWQGGVAFIAVSAVPFVAVTLQRRLIDAPRPYEMLSIYTTAPKKREGQSFPSRHVFSIFLISVLCIPWRIYVAVSLAVLALALATCRVLLGIHFVRDVVAGALIGVISGALGILIMSFI